MGAMQRYNLLPTGPAPPVQVTPMNHVPEGVRLGKVSDRSLGLVSWICQWKCHRLLTPLLSEADGKKTVKGASVQNPEETYSSRR